MRIALLLIAVSACIHAQVIECADGRTCPAGTTCNVVHHSCITDEQTTACDGVLAGQACAFAGLIGACVDGICLADDLDGDGLVGVEDNCPVVPNADQTDRDSDNFGDACDRCPDRATARNHDEDNDAVGDECDLCPPQSDFQDDADGDGVSSPCESSIIDMWTLVAFEPFVDLSAWTSSTSAWQSDGDSVAPLTDLAPIDLGIANSAIALAAPLTTTDELILEIGFASEHRWTTGEHFGVSLVDQITGARIVTSGVQCPSSSACAFHTTFSDGNVVTNSAVAPQPRSRLKVALTFDGVKHIVLPAVEGNGSYPSHTGLISGSQAIAAITTSPLIRVRYYAVWRVVGN